MRCELISKIIVIFMISSLFLSGLSFTIDGSNNLELKINENKISLFSAGSGTEDDPYQISNIKELQNVSNDLNAYYELVNDIDASMTKNWNDGKGFVPIAGDIHRDDGFKGTKFTGNIDGQGFDIIDLYINRSNSDFVGLFGYIGGDASVRDLNIIDADVNGGNFTGILAGYNRRGMIDKSYVNGEVDGGDIVGTFVGKNWGTINNSYAIGNVTGNNSTGGLAGTNYGTLKNSGASGNVSGDIGTGGFLGRNYYMVNNSYAKTDVKGNHGVGGLVGMNYLSINNSYAIGNVMGNNSTGGLVGWNYYGKISNSFWDIDTSGQSSSTGGTGKTTKEMKDIDTFTEESTGGLTEAWDFVDDPNDDHRNKDIWDINCEINNGYPFLALIGGDKTDIIPPRADAGESFEVSVSEQFILDAAGSSDNIAIESYRWIINDEIYNEKIVELSIDEIGEYTAELTVIDTFGNTDTESITVTVVDKIDPTADAGEDKTVKIDEEVTFDAFDSSDNVGITIYKWDFDDGTTDTGETVTHKFNKRGTYEVTLTVIDEAENTDSDTVTVTVEKKDDNGAPGFTIGVIILSITMVLLYRRFK